MLGLEIQRELGIGVKILNGHISAMGHLIHFVFGSMVGFLHVTA